MGSRKVPGFIFSKIAALCGHSFAMETSLVILLLFAASVAMTPLSSGLIVSIRPPLRNDDGANSVDGELNKIILTQRNYIQFVRYLVDVPQLPSFTFCLWMKSLNLSNPQPIFSYSMEETERIVRAWISPPGSGPDGPEGADAGLPQDAVTAAPHINLRVREEPVMSVPVPDLQIERWHHVCLHWTSGMGETRGMWLLYFDGGLRGTGVHAAKGDPGLVLPAGGDIAVGQELTDFSQGLDDGFEGELFGFNLAIGPWEGIGKALFETNFNDCTARGGGSPAQGIDPKGLLLVDWAKTPLRAYGGVLISPANPSCGNF